MVSADLPTLSLPRPEWHPMLPLLDESEVAGMLEHEDGLDRYKEWYRAHLQALAFSLWDEARPLATDPYRQGFKLPHWRQARWILGLGSPRTPEALEVIREDWKAAPFFASFAAEMQEALMAPLPAELMERAFSIWIGLGGNRATKSELCAWLGVESAMRVPNTTTFCVAETLETSRKTQQGLIWKYLPIEFKKLNRRSDGRGIFKIDYSLANGFGLAVPKLVLPNGSQIVFTTYNQEPAKQLEGTTLGSKSGRAVGMWLDESATTGWFDAGRRRCGYSGAVLLWSFTPVHGMTPAIKDAVGVARTLVSFPAELLSAEQRHVEDCPRGHMPYLALPKTAGAIVHYFPAQFNPFATHAGRFYDKVKEECRDQEGKPKSNNHIKCVAYGYTEDVSGRAFPGFGNRHLVTLSQIPSRLTLYQFTDPHGTKPYASVWIGVTPGNERERVYYVMRDFPDEQRYGEWAVPTTRETNEETRKGWDGDPGPAARPLGWGVAAYKREWLRLETIDLATELREHLTAMMGDERDDGADEARLKELLKKHVPQPWRRRILQGGKLDLEVPVREPMQLRHMDARFCNSESADEGEGLTTLALKFDQPHHGANGEELPAMFIQPVTGHGKTIADGLPLVNDLLDWNKDEEFIPGINAPRLYVWEGCKQVRWMFENYTGRAGEEGACKEWADLMRHLAKAQPPFIDPAGLKTRGGGWGY